jgi:hypothetical protein
MSAQTTAASSNATRRGPVARQALIDDSVAWSGSGRAAPAATASGTINGHARRSVDALTAFGLFAVSAMLVTYALEKRSHWFVLAFAGSCALGSAYGFLQGAWPFGLIEAIWSVVAIRRWFLARSPN